VEGSSVARPLREKRRRSHFSKLKNYLFLNCLSCYPLSRPLRATQRRGRTGRAKP